MFDRMLMFVCFGYGAPIQLVVILCLRVGVWEIRPGSWTPEAFCLGFE